MMNFQETCHAFRRRLQRFVGLRSKPKRLGLQFVLYSQAARMIRNGWTIAPEDDRNRSIGMVWLELLEGARCESCTNGYNGQNGNGYQPCGHAPGCEQPNGQTYLPADKGHEKR